MIVQTNNFHNAEMCENDALIFRYEKVTKSNGEDITKRYIQGRLLGFGSFAKVYQFTCPATRETFAAKMISRNFLKDEFNLQKVKAEIKLHKSLDHPNIVKFHRSFEDDESLYILLELCPNESLSHLLKRKKKFSETEAKEYIVQIVLALKYLHEQKVLHRDLKLANLLLNSKMQLKMADFGLAAKLSSNFEKRKTSCGTPNFMAPEVMDPDRSYSYPADIWSFGVICYNMLTGRLPFEGNTTREVYHKVRDGKFTFPPAITLSTEAKDFITKILVLEPEKRLTLSQIQAHAFLNIKSEASSPKVSIPIAALESFSTATASRDSDKSPKLCNLFHKVDAISTPENKMTRHKSASPSKVLAKALSQLQLTKPTSPIKQTRKPMLPNFNSETIINNSRSSPTHKRLVRQNTAQIRIFLQAEQDQEDAQLVKGVWQDGTPTYKVPEYIRSSEARFVVPEKKEISSLKNSMVETPKYKRDVVQSPHYKKKQAAEQRSIIVDSKNGSRVEKGLILEKEASTDNMVVVASPPRPEWSDVKVIHWSEGTENCVMGYLLADGCVGIFFSDDTKMQLSQKGDHFYYIVKGLGGKEAYTKYGVHQFPGMLKEKVMELQRMKRNFEKQGHKGAIEQESNGEVVYVKKWLKTKHGTFFKLSNKELQVVLIDKSSLFLDSEEKKVKYIDQKGEVKIYAVGSESLNATKEVKKRLLYTMEVLEKIWKKNDE